jgi:L-2-hydroxyglutarate oxidase LhgO
MAAGRIPSTRRVKGNYFSLDGRSPFRHLIYPLPDEGSLGVHCTLDLAGQARFGPDVEWPIDDATPDLAVDPARRDAFVASIARYWPGVRDAALSPAYAGLRPRITGRGEPLADFVFSGPDDHGIAGLIHLFGIESPGLTSSLAIAEHVLSMVGR